MYRQKLHYFEYMFSDDELIKEFEEYIDTNLRELFTYAEHFNTKIRVTLPDVQSVVKNRKVKGVRVLGSYRQLITSVVNTISMQASNRSNFKNRHQQAIFAIILKESRTFQKLMIELRKYRDNLVSESFAWNRVFYGKYDKFTGGKF